MRKKSEKLHYSTIKEEFARQADSLQESQIFTDRDIIERIISALDVTDNLRILDVGCGPGIVTTAMAISAKEVVAFDITPEMIEHARKRCGEAGLNNVRFKLGQAEKLPFEDDSFDAVVTRLTFHHFVDPTTVISEMVRVTRPEGKVIIADIVSSEDPSESELHNSLEVLRDPSHVRMLPHTELRWIIESAGLKIITDDSWSKRREFGEWIRITNAPDRAKPLHTVMRRLAEAGVKSGIDLYFDAPTLKFNHKWAMIVAKKTKKMKIN